MKKRGKIHLAEEFKNPLVCTECAIEYSCWDDGYVCPNCGNDMSGTCKECRHANVLHTSDIFNKCRMAFCPCDEDPMGMEARSETAYVKRLKKEALG